MDWKVSGEFSFRSKLLLCIYAPSTQSAMHNFFPEHQYIVLSTSNDDLAYILVLPELVIGITKVLRALSVRRASASERCTTAARIRDTA